MILGIDVQRIIQLQIKQGAHQKHIAVVYHLGLKQNEIETDWKSVNQLIIDQWSVHGLKRIKQMAWKMKI